MWLQNPPITLWSSESTPSALLSWAPALSWFQKPPNYFFILSWAPGRCLQTTGMTPVHKSFIFPGRLSLFFCPTKLVRTFIPGLNNHPTNMLAKKNVQLDLAMFCVFFLGLSLNYWNHATDLFRHIPGTHDLLTAMHAKVAVQRLLEAIPRSEGALGCSGGCKTWWALSTRK